MPHKLDGAFERVGRAGEHLDELQRRLKGFSEQCANEVLANLNLEPIEQSNEPKIGFKPLPLDFTKLDLPSIFSILVGEICYNLRSALDYLVYELALSDSGVDPQSKTQFPIEDFEHDRKGRKKILARLSGLNAAHIATGLVADPTLGPEATLLWIGRRPGFTEPAK